jgi:nucleoside-diphosphate-sugar epimerase
MNLLITGATGFIGRHLSAYLTLHNHEVIALMRRPDELSDFRAKVTELGGKGHLIHALEGDLTLPKLGIDKSIPGIGAVIHLGARFAWRLDRESAQAANVNGSLAVAELAQTLGCRLVFISGFMLENPEHLKRVGVDVARPERTDWASVYRRTGAYEASKLESAVKVRLLAEKTELDLVEVQPATVAGHSQTGELDQAQPLYQLIANLAGGRLTVVPGTPDHWLPLVTVDHVVAVIAAAAMATNPPRRLLCLDSDTPALQPMLAIAGEALGIQSPGRHIPLPVLRVLLSIPGVSGFMNTYPEALHFIQTKRFDTAITDQFLGEHGLHRPDIRSAIQVSARWYQRQAGDTPLPG